MEPPCTWSAWSSGRSNYSQTLTANANRNHLSFHFFSLLLLMYCSFFHRFTPIGILFLVGGQILLITDFGAFSRQLAMYTITVIVSLAIHSLVTLPIIYIAVTRKSPLKFLGGLVNALTTALGTSSRWVQPSACNIVTALLLSVNSIRLK